MAQHVADKSDILAIRGLMFKNKKEKKGFEL